MNRSSNSDYRGGRDAYTGSSSYSGRGYGGGLYRDGGYANGSSGADLYGDSYGSYGAGSYGDRYGSYGGTYRDRGYSGSAYTRRGAGGSSWAGDYGSYGAGYGTGTYRYDTSYGYGGMRSDAAGDWRSYAGEDGWLARGYAGYANVSDLDRWGGGYAGYGSAHSEWADTDSRPDVRVGTFAYAEFEEDNLQDWGGARQNLGDAGRVRARDLMTEDPEVVTPSSTLAEAAAKMRDLDVGIIPVVDDRTTMSLRGVITDRDIAVRAAAEAKDMAKSKVSDFMTEDVSTCEEEDSVRAIFDVMKREQVRRVPIVDQDGRLVGIVAQADLAVDYAGLDLGREAEVEEVVERISEPATPRRWDYSGSNRNYGMRPEYRGSRGRYDYDLDLRATLRRGWKAVKREARELMDR